MACHTKNTGWNTLIYCNVARPLNFVFDPSCLLPRVPCSTHANITLMSLQYVMAFSADMKVVIRFFEEDVQLFYVVMWLAVAIEVHTT